MLPRGLLTFNKKVSWDRHAEERCFALPTLESQQAQREKEGHFLKKKMKEPPSFSFSEGDAAAAAGRESYKRFLK